MKKMLAGLIGIMLLASMAYAQHPHGIITGQIVDDSSGNGISWAEVTATKITGDPFERTVHSLWDGNYGISHLPPGSYVVSATKLGWSEGMYPDTIMVDDDLHEDIDIFLTEIPINFGSIAGVITDASTSDPIENAHVEVRGPGYWNVHHVDTGTDGAYMVDELPPGDYMVSAHKMDYFPGEFPDPVTIDGNDTSGIDIALSPIVPTGIRGTVTDLSTSDPIEGALVYAVNVNHWQHHRLAVTDENGEYEFDAPPGEYHLTAFAMGYLPEQYPTTVMVPETGYVEDIDFALTGFNFGSISGNVTDTSGAPLEHARVVARMYDSFFGRAAWTDENGDYTIENLLPGNYGVNAHKWGYQSAAYPDTVTVPDGGNVPDIDFALVPFGPNDGVISGTVTDDSTGMPIEGAQLLAFGQTNTPWHHCVIRRVFTDENGEYMFEDLPHLQYKIFTHAHGYHGEFYDDVQHYSEATEITPDTSGIDVGLAPWINPGVLSISGRILNPEGNFVDGGVVFLMSDGEIVNSVEADLEGYYGFAGLNPGTYEIAVFTPYGTGSFDQAVELTFSDYRNADITIAVTSVDDYSDLLPEKASLNQNYPNPFNANTTISFNLSQSENVEISIYNIVGQKIATLLDGQMSAGEHSIIWNGRSDKGDMVSSGVYFYRLATDNLTETKRMTFLK